MPSPTVRRLLHRIASAGVVAAVLSCSGATPATEPQTEEPYPGTPVGEPISQQIGAGGGSMGSSDGAFTVTFPTGALTTPTNITIRSFVNTAPRGFGHSYRIEPANLQFIQPVTITLTINEDALGGHAPGAVGMGIRSKTGEWTADMASTTDVPAPAALAVSAATSGGRVVSVTRVSVNGEWAEYTIIAFWLLDPKSATVEIGNSVQLSVLACTLEEVTTSPGGEYLLPTQPGSCRPSIREGTWRVNGEVGGNNAVGVVSTGSAPVASQVLYIAPSQIPTPNPVAVQASMFWRERGLTKVMDPIPITIIGNALVGAASGTVTSPVAGALYDYTAKVTWTLQQGYPAPGLPRVYRPSGYVKYTAAHRCISNLRPDSIPLNPSEAQLLVNLQDSTWEVGLVGFAGPVIQYYDTCAEMDSYLEFTGAPYIDSDGPETLPVKGTIDIDYGVKVQAAFSYVREGESVAAGRPTSVGISPAPPAKSRTRVR